MQTGRFAKKHRSFAVQALVLAMNAFAEGPFRDVTVFVLTTVFVTYLGPFGTGEDLDPVLRAVYWTAAIGAGFAGGRLFRVFVKPALIRRRRQVLYGPVGALMITAFAGVAVLGLEAWLRQPVPLRYAYIPLSSVFVMAVAIWAVFELGGSVAVAPPDIDPLFEDFRKRWPADLRNSPLLALSAEDHYVRVHTQDGDALIAGRFAEALEAVALQPGSRVHRSWWVADGAPDRLDRQGGRWVLRARDLRIPVSRRYRPDVRAKGWDRLG